MLTVVLGVAEYDAAARVAEWGGVVAGGAALFGVALYLLAWALNNRPPRPGAPATVYSQVEWLEYGARIGAVVGFVLLAFRLYAWVVG